VGTIVALVAAVLLAVAIATPGWWSGNPTINDQFLNRKAAHIGLITAKQCNFADGADTECKHLAVAGTLGILKFVQLGVTGALALSLIGFGIARARRKGFSKLVMLTVVAATVSSVVMLVVGPELKSGATTSMPIGYSFIMFFVGSALGIASGVLGLLPPRAPRPPPPMWSAPMQQAMPSQPQQPPAFDVQALLAEDALRPAALGPEPMLGKPHSPGGMLPGPAGPLVPPSGPQPLFNAAPQLRPLYETTGGSVPPAPAVQFPVRGPTPMPQAAVSALVGNDTPSPSPMAPAPPPPRLPPPSRTKPLTAPPIPPIPRTKPVTKPPPPRPQPTLMSAAVPPPPRASEAGDHVETVDYKKQSPGDDSLAFDTTAESKAFDEDTHTDTGEDIETAAREKVDNTDVELASRPSTSVVTSANPQVRNTPTAVKVPITTAPDTLPPPTTEDQPGGPSPACPQCEAPMGWVEEHLRFYCKSCRMYF